MWIEESGSESDEIHDRKIDSDSGSNIDSSEDEDGDSAITHRVVFKCIGCTKEHHYQVILAEVARRMRQCEEVPVKVVKEPNNPVDPRAIAFVCKLNQLKNGRELAM